MALTKHYKTTVLRRIERDPKFAAALRRDATNELLAGDVGNGLAILKDLAHAGPGIPELARRTGLGEKTIHRMLSRRGNPTIKNLNAILKNL